MRNLKTGGRVSFRKVSRHHAPILMSIALLITISLTAIRATQAQVACMNKCQQQLNECLDNPEGSNCLDDYDACLATCTGSVADLLG